MKKKTFIIYASFIWTKTLLGLTFHPYLSIKETVRRPILLPVIFSPLITLFAFFLAAKIASILITIYGLQRDAAAIFLGTVLISISFWQILLLYLLCMFLAARSK